MALDDLEIVIDVVDSFSDEINELLANLESVDIQADRVDDIYLDVTNLAGDEISELQGQLASLTDEDVVVDTDIRGESQLLSYGALKEAVAADEVSNIDFEEHGLDNIIAKLSVANSEAMALRALSSGVGFGGGGDEPPVSPFRYGGEAQGGGGDTSLFTMADLHNVLASLIPMLLVYIGALPAAIGGVVALGAAAVSAAAALGALGALGGLGFALVEGNGDAMKGLSEMANQVSSDFMDAFEPLARDLAPLFEDGLNGLALLFDALASYGDILRSLTDEARAFGQYMGEYIVGTAASMAKLAEAAAPTLALIGQAIADLNLLEGAARFLSSVLPYLWSFGESIMSILDTILQLSVGFLAVSTVITNVIDALLLVVSGFGMFKQTAGAAIGAILGLLTASSMLYSLITGGLIEALAANAAMMWQGSVAATAAAAKEYLLADATFTLAGALSTLKTVLAVTVPLLALLGVIGSIASNAFGDASDSIKDATDSLKEFEDVQGSLGGMGSGSSNVYEFNPTNKQVQINANNVQDAKRTSRHEEFSTNNYTISQ